MKMMKKRQGAKQMWREYNGRCMQLPEWSPYFASVRSVSKQTGNR